MLEAASATTAALEAILEAVAIFTLLLDAQLETMTLVLDPTLDAC